MAGSNRNSYELQSFESRSLSRPRSTLPKTTWSSCADVRSKQHVSPGGRSNQALCTSKVSLQFNGFQLVTGPHTIFDFVQMLGPEGMEKLNTTFLREAQNLGILDATSMMSDMTAQEAMIPYPSEVGLMKRFTEIVLKTIPKAGTKASKIKSKVKEIASKVKSLVRASHLFAKTKEQKQKVGKKLYHTTMELHDLVTKCLSHSTNIKNKSVIELQRLSNLMNILLPQILHFIKTGFVAPKKIIHLQMSELYVAGWEGSGIWNQMGYQMNRWFCARFCDGQHGKCIGQEILYRFNPKAYRTFWTGSGDIWLRQRWLQWSQYQQGEKAWREKRGYGAAWSSRLERVDEDVGEDKMRASASRRCYREFIKPPGFEIFAETQIEPPGRQVSQVLVLGFSKQILQSSNELQKIL